MWYDICVLRMCLYALHKFHRLSQSTVEYSNYFTFRAKFFLYFLAITIGGRSFMYFVEFFARFHLSNSFTPFILLLSLFFSLSRSRCRHNKYSLSNMFSEVFYALLCMCLCVCILLSTTDWFIVCLSVSLYFVHFSFVCSYIFTISLVEVQVYFFISSIAITINRESFEFHAHSLAS